MYVRKKMLAFSLAFLFLIKNVIYILMVITVITINYNNMNDMQSKMLGQMILCDFRFVFSMIHLANASYITCPRSI